MRWPRCFETLGIVALLVTLGGCTVGDGRTAPEVSRAGSVSPGTAAPVPGQETSAERVRRILSEVPLIDGHNDLPGKIREIRTSEGDVGLYDLRRRTEGDTDLPRLREGMVGAQFWSVQVDANHPRPAMQQLEQIDIAYRLIEAYPDELEFAGSASDVQRVFGSGKIASLLGIEGGHVIENSLGALRAFYRAGVRYMGLTHFSNTDWADSGTADVVWDGLSPFGEEVVREMNRLGMLVDLSHVAVATMSDALNVTEAPVIFSHAAARALADHPRNVPDPILVRLRENRGLLMQLFYPPYLDPSENPTATISDVADHLEHIRDVAGIESCRHRLRLRRDSDARRGSRGRLDLSGFVRRARPSRLVGRGAAQARRGEPAAGHERGGGRRPSPAAGAYPLDEDDRGAGQQRSAGTIATVLKVKLVRDDPSGARRCSCASWRCGS